VLRALQQALARCGQADAALDAVEQQKAQLPLQNLDFAASAPIARRGDPRWLCGNSAAARPG